MKTLIIVDVQNDFIAGGALAVPEGETVIPLINRLQPKFDLIVATQDWHPPDHGSFAANHPGRQMGEVVNLAGQSQVLWPVHCVQGTAGANFATGWIVNAGSAFFKRGRIPPSTVTVAFSTTAIAAHGPRRLFAEAGCGGTLGARDWRRIIA